MNKDSTVKSPKTPEQGLVQTQKNNNNIQEYLQNILLKENFNIANTNIKEIIVLHQSINKDISKQLFYSALSELQYKLTPIIKTRETKTSSTKSGASYSFKYANLADIMEMLTPLLKNFGFAITHQFKENSYITFLTHKEGYELSTNFDLDGITLPQIGGVQEIGAIKTYAKRYNIIDLLNISTDDDNENNLSSGIKQKERAENYKKRAKEQEVKTKNNKVKSFIDAINKSLKTDKGENTVFGTQGNTLKEAYLKMLAIQQDGLSDWNEAIHYYEKSFFKVTEHENLIK